MTKLKEIFNLTQNKRTNQFSFNVRAREIKKIGIRPEQLLNMNMIKEEIIKLKKLNILNELKKNLPIFCKCGCGRRIKVNVNNFKKIPSYINGHNNRGKKIMNYPPRTEIDKEYLDNQLKRKKETRKKYQLLHGDKIKEYYNKNKDKIREKQKKYCYNNKDKVNKYQRNYVSKRRKKDISFKVSSNLRNRVKQAIKKYANGKRIINCKDHLIDYKKIIEHLKPFPPDINNYEVDHIVPLHLFDFTNKEQIKKAFLPENNAWLLVEANRKKQGKLVHPDFYKKFGYNP
jgi:hypothetical protein